jgi:hypothetical protein
MQDGWKEADKGKQKYLEINLKNCHVSRQNNPT